MNNMQELAELFVKPPIVTKEGWSCLAVLHMDIQIFMEKRYFKLLSGAKDEFGFPLSRYMNIKGLPEYSHSSDWGHGPEINSNSAAMCVMSDYLVEYTLTSTKNHLDHFDILIKRPDYWWWIFIYSKTVVYYISPNPNHKKNPADTMSCNYTYDCSGQLIRVDVDLSNSKNSYFKYPHLHEKANHLLPWERYAKYSEYTDESNIFLPDNLLGSTRIGHTNIVWQQNYFQLFYNIKQYY